MRYTHTENGQILYDGLKMEMFVPDDFFKSNLAEEVGTNYSIFGAVRCIHYSNENESRDHAKTTFLYYPAKFITSPNRIEDEKIDFGNGEEKYKVFIYYKNDVLFNSNIVIKSASNIEVLIKLLINGKLDIVKYGKIPKMISLGKYYNGVSFGVPAMYEEIIISDYYRDPKDVTRPARYPASVSDSNFYSRGITQREKVSFTSTFSGITYEDINTMLTMADNAKRNGKEEVISQMEKISLNRGD